MSILARGRMAAESRMTSRATIRRKTGDVDGVDQWSTVHADLPLRLAGARGGTAQSRRLNVAGTELQVAVREAHFPADTSDLRDGDLIDVTSGDNSGLVLRIIEADWQDQSTARRVPVVAATRPEEWS